MTRDGRPVFQFDPFRIVSELLWSQCLRGRAGVLANYPTCRRRTVSKQRALAKVAPFTTRSRRLHRHLAERLEQAVAASLRADAPLGVFLSGGVVPVCWRPSPSGTAPTPSGLDHRL